METDNTLTIKSSNFELKKILVSFLFIVLYFLFERSIKFIPYIGWWPIDLFVVGIIALSVFVLSIYFVYNPDVADTFPLSQMPKYVVPFAILLMATINGLREEYLFRFILQRCLINRLNLFIAIFLQAFIFGLIHYQFGFPRGYLGVFLTTLFGIAVGFQYHHFRSFTLTWFTHSLVDFIMFAIILGSKSSG